MVREHLPLIVSLGFAVLGVLTAVTLLGVALVNSALRGVEALVSSDEETSQEFHLLRETFSKQTSPDILRSCRRSRVEQRTLSSAR